MIVLTTNNVGKNNARQCRLTYPPLLSESPLSVAQHSRTLVRLRHFPLLSDDCPAVRLLCVVTRPGMPPPPPRLGALRNKEVNFLYMAGRGFGCDGCWKDLWMRLTSLVVQVM